MADQTQSGGLLGMDPDLLTNIGLGLLSVGGKNLAGQGNLGQAMQGALGNYYAQKQAKQSLQMNQVDLQQKQLGNQKMKSLLDMVGQLAGPPADPQGVPQQTAAPQPTQAPPFGGSPGAGPGALPSPGAQGPGASGAPGPQFADQPPTQTPQQQPSFNMPTAADIAQMPVNGMNPRMLQAYNLLAGKDPLQSSKEQGAAQLEQAQRQYAPTLGKLQTIIKSDTPAKYVQSDPSLRAAWSTFAPQLGYTQPSDFNDQNVRTALTYGHNQLAAAIGLPGLTPTVKTIQGKAPDGRITQTDPITGKVTYESAGPEVITAQQRIENAREATRLQLEQQQKAADLARVGVPNGYERAPTSDNPNAVRPIEGGPSDPLAVAGGMGNRNEVMFQRTANAGNSAAESIKNITELPITASTGWFGTARPGTSLLGSVKGVLTQKVNDQDIQDYQTMLAGVSRNLATLETSGLSPGGSLTHSMDALTLGQGDTNLTKLRKVAEMRQIVNTNLQPQLSNPKIPQPQKDMIRDIIDKVNTAVPFTHSDITKLEQSRNPRATIMDYASGSGLTAHPDDIQAILNKYPAQK